jgi:hypothetical protein
LRSLLRPFACTLFLFLLASLAERAGAQTLRIHAVVEGSRLPVAGAIVEAIDANNSVQAQGLLSELGTRSLTLPRAAAYRVRLRRIGYAPYVGPLLQIGAGETRDVELVAPGRLASLAAMMVTASARKCGRDAFADTTFAAFWEEVSKALTSSVLGRESGGVLQMRAFRRTLDVARRVRSEQTGMPHLSSALRPYIARSADDLADSGYVRLIDSEFTFLAPDELVLLSDRFVSDHCFGVVRERPGLMGVQFASVGRRDNDIAGIVWIDSASAELRSLDYWNVSNAVPRDASGRDHTGGELVFDRTKEGRWMVGAWRIRMPSLSGRRTLRGYEEYGGVVSGLRGDSVPPHAALAPYYEMLRPAVITGLVFDSLKMRPIVGARVTLVPMEDDAANVAGVVPAGPLAVTEAVASSDSSGLFSLPPRSAGSYMLRAQRPDIDSSDVSPLRSLQLRPGQREFIVLATPSRAMLAKSCPPSRQRGAGFVLGHLRAAGDDRPLENALVQISWTEIERDSGMQVRAVPIVHEVRSDALGAYRFCQVPDSTLIAVRAAGPRSRTGAVTFQLAGEDMKTLDLRLAEVEDGETTPPPGVISGIVMDSAAAPLANVQLSIDGSELVARTDGAGRFLMSGASAGTQSILLRRLGFDPVSRRVDVRPGATTSITVRLGRIVLLEAMTSTSRRSTATPAIADAVRRHRTGIGFLLTEAEIAQRPSIRQLMSDIPGVTIGSSLSGGWKFQFKQMAGLCDARVFLDGRESDMDVLRDVLSPETLGGIEVFSRASTAPIWTAGPNTLTTPHPRNEQCGVVLLWTKGYSGAVR